MLPTIQPFSGYKAECTKCGNAPLKAKFEDMPVFRGSMPPYPVGSIALTPASLRTRYCPGGKELPRTEDENATVQGAENLTTILKQFLPIVANQFGGSFAGQHICVGITEEHLHITCNNCGHEWLTQTADQTQNAEPETAARA